MRWPIRTALGSEMLHVCRQFHRLCLWMMRWAKDNDVDVNSTYRSSIKMRGSSKMAWIVVIRTTRYPLILILCCNVVMFFSQARSFQWRRFRVASPKLLIVWKKIFFTLFARLKIRDISGMTWRWQLFFLAEKRTRNLLFAYVDVHISCKMMHSRGAWCNSLNCPWTNSPGDISPGK